MPDFRVRFNQLLYNQEMCNVVHFRSPNPGFNADSVKAELEANWIQQVKVMQANVVIWTSLDVTDLANPQGGAVRKILPSITGTATQATNVGICTSILSFKVPFKTKHAHYRYYVVGSREDWWSQGRMSASGVTAATVPVNNLRNRYILGGTNVGPLTILCRERANGTLRDATEIVLRDRMGVQRRRNIGVGQ